MKTLQKLLLLTLVSAHQLSQAQPRLEKGLVDLRQYDFADNGAFTLDGEWEFYMSQLISPGDFSTIGGEPKDYVDFPSAWNISAGTQNFGFATYRLTLQLNAKQSLALQIPHCYSNYTLWANGKIISANGVVGKSPDQSKPQWLPATVNLPSETTVSLILQISNFHHAIGGIRESILLGDREDMHFRKSVSLTSNLVLVVGLLVLALVAGFVCILYKSNAVLFFACFTLAWGVREAFSNLYLGVQYMPDFPWAAAVKIEYTTLFLVMIFSMLFIGSLFKEDVNTVFKYLFCFCNLVFIGIAVFLDASVYTQFLPVYLSFAAALLIFIVYVLIRAVVYERQGVWLIIACLFLGVIIFSYDLISYQGLANFNPIIISIGYLSMFALMSVALLFQVGIFKRSAATNMLTYDDLYGGNK
ncbi:MAG TPA: 7TM-DISM domain-containing protein [Chryseosolibacter sp.]